MIKKIMGVLASTLLATSVLVGCGGSGSSYSLTEKNTVEGIVEYQIKNIELVDRVDPIKPAEQYKYFKVNKAENKLLNIEVEVKNLKSEKVNAKELFDTQIGAVKMMDGNKLIESVNGDNLLDATTTDVEANESRLMHFIYEVSPTVVDTKLNFDVIVGENRFSNKIKISELQYPKKSAKIGDIILNENYSEVKLVNLQDKEKLEPSNPKGVYYEYSQKEGGKLKVLTVEVKNLSDKEIDADKILSFVGIYGEEYKYAKASCDSLNGNDLEYASTVKIQPNESRLLYLYYDMSIEEIEKEVVLKLGLGFDRYTIE